MIREDKDKKGNSIFAETQWHMRILVIHNFYQHAGGEDTVFDKEVEALSTVHDVKTVTYRNQKGIKGVGQFIGYPANLSVSRHLKKVIFDFRPDIVHIHNLHYAIGPWAIRAIKETNIPIVMTLHNFRLLCPSASLFYRGDIFTKSVYENFPWSAVRQRVLDNSYSKTFLTAFTYWTHRKLGTWNKVSKFIVLSDFAKSLFAQSTFPVSTDRFIVRANSLDTTASLSEKARHGFVFIGRLSEEKGIVPLLQAFSTLPYDLSIYGAGPQQNIAEEYTHKFQHIHYHGHQPVEVLQQALQEAEALIVPSVCYEGMPLTIIEAYAQGTAVLASDIGVLTKMILPLYTGLHFKPNNAQDLAQVVHEWVSLDQTIKQKIQLNCLTEYYRHYTSELNMEKLISIYQEAIIENEKKNNE